MSNNSIINNPSYSPSIAPYNVDTGYVTKYNQETNGLFTCTIQTIDVNNNPVNSIIEAVGIINSFSLESPNQPDQILIMSFDNKYIFYNNLLISSIQLPLYIYLLNHYQSGIPTTIITKQVEDYINNNIKNTTSTGKTNISNIINNTSSSEEDINKYNQLSDNNNSPNLNYLAYMYAKITAESNYNTDKSKSTLYMNVANYYKFVAENEAGILNDFDRSLCYDIEGGITPKMNSHYTQYNCKSNQTPDKILDTSSDISSDFLSSLQNNMLFIGIGILCICIIIGGSLMFMFMIKSKKIIKRGGNYF